MNGCTPDVQRVVDFAIRTEEKGERFYRAAAEVIEDRAVKELFVRLAEDEITHRKTFETILSELGAYEPKSEDGPGVLCREGFLDTNAVFNDDLSIPELAKASSVKAALDFAIQREMDSIRYYQEINMFVGAEHGEAIDLIIDEERKHFASLSKLRRETARA